jgi:hypothetical protein
VLGFVLCAPALIAVLEPLATRSRGVVRLAARDIARQRARTGPLVAAILAVASLALLGWSFVSAEKARFGDSELGIGPDQVLLSTFDPLSSRHRQIAVPEQLRARVRALLPRANRNPDRLPRCRRHGRRRRREASVPQPAATAPRRRELSRRDRRTAAS